MRIEEEVKLDYADVLIRPKRSTLPSRNAVVLHRKFKMKYANTEWSGIPIIASNMDTIGTLDMTREMAKYRCVTALHKFFTAEELFDVWNDLTIETNDVFFTFGVSDSDKKKMIHFHKLIKDQANTMLIARTDSPMICLDVANGYFERFAEEVEFTRKLFPKSIIMAGNVCTPEMTEQLILSGADIVKIGIGPGSVCTTRNIAGVGYPQLSAVIECADAAHGMGGLVCADGGCVNPGDVAKAYGGGADFVMLGGMLSGHDECGGELVYDDSDVAVLDHGVYETPGKLVGMKFYGMSSETAMDTHHGGVAGYRASEGKSVVVPYKGPVSNTMSEILGGLRSMMTYIGASSLKKVSRATTFIRVSRQLNTSMNGMEK